MGRSQASAVGGGGMAALSAGMSISISIFHDAADELRPGTVMALPSSSPRVRGGLTTGVVVGGRVGEEGGTGTDDEGGTHLESGGGWR